MASHAVGLGYLAVSLGGWCVSPAGSYAGLILKGDKPGDSDEHFSVDGTLIEACHAVGLSASLSSKSALGHGPAPVVDAARWVRAANDVNIAARPSAGARRTPSEDAMAKKQADTVYKIVDVVGVSETSWEDAGRNAVETAAGSLRDLRVAEVTKMDMKVENGKVAAFRTRVALSFKYED
jgi:dodecin